MFGNYFNSKSGRSKKAKLEREKFEAQLQSLEDRFAIEVPKERAARLTESPAVAEIYRSVLQLGDLLWTRRPEHWNFLDIRLGLGTLPSRNVLDQRSKQQGLPKETQMLDDFQERFATIDGVPVVENLHIAGALGICGPATPTADALRGIIVQVAGLHSPAEVSIAALMSPRSRAEFEWLSWLPHSSSPHSPMEGIHLADSAPSCTQILNELEDIIDARLEENKRPVIRGTQSPATSASSRPAKIVETNWSPMIDVDLPSVVVIIDGDAPFDRARLIDVLEKAADAQVYPIWFSRTRASLPAVCRTFVDVSNGLTDAEVNYVRLGTAVQHVTIEGVSLEYANTLSRRIAPVVDASAPVADSSDLPRSVSTLALMGNEIASETSTVANRWRENISIHDRSGAAPVARKKAGGLRAIIGMGPVDPMHIDLRMNGPHALVGGTTGSGKSEFLQTWVLGMASEYSPDRLTFLFIDYKGGSAFAECVNLPHCVGLVTDLSQHLVRRALTSLRAELHYREHLFNRKKVKDLLEFEKTGDPECPPALVLVIDEFAALVGEVPDFVDGVVDIGQRGRSLGIHLIMATQRPAGIIKDNLRANTNLRIALRMNDESDSRDVVGDKVAAGFDPSIPGRGIAKMGPGRLHQFQAGYSGGWTTDTEEPAVVTINELRFGSNVQWEPPQAPDSGVVSEDPGPNDQKRIVTTMVRATEELGIPAPRRPWLDEIPATVALESLEIRGDTEVVFGHVDRPERQAQEAVAFYPDKDGHLGIYGTSGSGKSAAARTIAVSAALSSPSSPVEVYGLDFGTGGLRMLEALPHVGSIISGDDNERVTRLLRIIRETMDERARRYSDANASSITEYRKISGRNDPRIYLLLDNFQGFRDEYDTTVARMAYYSMLLGVINEGRPLGVHLIFTADRGNSVPTSVQSNIQRKLILRQAGRDGYTLFSVPKDVLDENSVPGRAIVDKNEAQVAIVGNTSNVAEQAKKLEPIAEKIASFGFPPAAPIRQLPREVSASDLPVTVNGLPLLGIADTTLEPIGFNPEGSFLIAGPPGSGKTNAMLTIAQTLMAYDSRYQLYFFGSKRSELLNALPWTETAMALDETRELASTLAELAAADIDDERILVVIDTVTEYTGGDADAQMAKMVKAINRSSHSLIADGDSNVLSGGWGMVGEVKANRKGIALVPDTLDGDQIFKVQFPRVKRSETPVGRGFFVSGSKVELVHLPLARR